MSRKCFSARSRYFWNLNTKTATATFQNHTQDLEGKETANQEFHLTSATYSPCRLRVLVAAYHGKPAACQVRL